MRTSIRLNATVKDQTDQADGSLDFLPVRKQTSVKSVVQHFTKERDVGLLIDCELNDVALSRQK